MLSSLLRFSHSRSGLDQLLLSVIKILRHTRQILPPSYIESFVLAKGLKATQFGQKLGAEPFHTFQALLRFVGPASDVGSVCIAL